MSETKNWHAMSAEQVLSALESTPTGLSHAAAQQRLVTFGRNRLPEPPQSSVVMRLLAQFHNVLIYVLLGSSLITLLLDHWIDASVILAVVVANAIIGFVQEGKAEQAMNSIRAMLAPRAAVLRDGQRHSIPGEELVPGDIVLLEAGDKVPADLRVLTSHGLQVQEAILTGESIAVEKTVESVDAGAELGDRTCMVFSGTSVASGQATGVVMATGEATEIGRISGLLAGVEVLTTPLFEQMQVLSKWLTTLILAVAALVLLFGFSVLEYDFTELFMAVVGLSVAAIPEGLPAVLTITLAIGVRTMARKNAIVRRLPAIETMGAVSVICTDKTGTLTRNEMSVVTLVTQAQSWTITGSGYEPQGEVLRDDASVAVEAFPILAELGRVALLCNDAELKYAAGVWSVEGDPMEGALLAFAGKVGLKADEQKNVWPRTDIIPFDARHKFMATLHHDHEGHAAILVKGAPEAILALCHAQHMLDGACGALDLPYWNAQAESIAAQGQRVLALAAREVPPEHTVLERHDVEGSLVFLGLVGLMDPPRLEAIDAVAVCLRAGIAVKMITGDHAHTAAAIGRQIGLAGSDQVLTGSDLNQMDDEQLASQVLHCNIFARTSPEHKLRLVKALQAHGMTVAMTGDGVNDAPALKRADVGIAMGKKGSEAAKEASELVLADDNFASIAAAVREGRTVYDNIKKVISWSLPTNSGEAATIIMALLLGMTLPITPVQILWVNMVTAVTLSIVLAFEPTEERTMLRAPRRRQQPLLSGTLVWHIILVTLLFLAGVFGMYSHAIERGYSVELARTIAMNTLVVMEIFHLFFIRNMYGTSLTWQAVRGTRVIWLAVVAVVAAQSAITYLPPMQGLFLTVAVPLWDGVMIVGVGVALFVIIELEKQIRLRWQKTDRLSPAKGS